MPRPSNLAQGVAWMLGAVFSFCAMAIASRELLRHMGALEIVFMRSLMMVLIVVPITARAGFAAVRTRRLGVHLMRNFAHVAGQCGWVYSIGMLTLATVFAIEFTMPVWVALLAALFLGERLTGPRIVMLVLGFAGVLIIVRPGYAIVHPAALVMLGTSLAYAANLTFTKTLSSTDSPLSVLFWMSMIQAPITLLLALPGWVAPVAADLPWIVLIGSASYSAHYCLTRAFKLGDAVVMVPIDFIRLPLIALIGFVFYAERLELPVLAGAAVIFAGTYFSLSRERR